MTTPSHPELQRYYERFAEGHDASRDKLLADIRGVDVTRGRSPLRRWWLPGFVAAAAACAGLVLMLMPGATPISWADVARQLQHIHAFSCRWTDTESAGAVATTETTLSFWRAPDQSRTDVSSRPASTAETYIINATGHPHTEYHRQGGIGITQKVYFGSTPTPPVETKDWFTRLRDIAQVDQVICRGEEKVDGRTLVRFEDHSGFGTGLEEAVLTAWVDSKTSLPVRARVAGSRGGKRYSVEMDDLRFDPPLADDLFEWPKVVPQVVEGLQVYLPSGSQPQAVRLELTVGNDQLEISPSDFKPLRKLHDGGAAGDLTETSTARLEQFAGSKVGRRMRLETPGLPTQEVEIAGPIKFLGIIVPGKPIPATRP